MSVEEFCCYFLLGFCNAFWFAAWFKWFNKDWK